MTDIDPFAVVGPIPPRASSPAKTASIRWKLKGQTDGPIYAGSALIKPCATCGSSNMRPPTRVTEDTPLPVARSFFPLDPVSIPNLGKMVIYTLSYGSPDWLPETMPTLRAWCSRHQMELIEWSDIPAEYPSPKFVEVDMLRHFLASDADWMMYVDADVIAHERAPHPFALVDQGAGLYMREDVKHIPVCERWPRWVENNFQRTPRNDYRYRNAGVWAIDRHTARDFLQVCQPPYVAGQMEQLHWNVWVHDFTGPVHDLDEVWNGYANVKGRPIMDSVWLYHIAGRAKMPAIQSLRDRGFLPNRFSEPDWGHWIEGDLDEAIVIPLKLSADPWKGESLRMVLRSIEEHWSPAWPVRIVGDECPAWLDPSVFIHAPEYETALLRGLSCARQVLWMNDDILFLRSSDTSDFVRPWHMGPLDVGSHLMSKSSWSSKRARAALIATHAKGGEALNFSTHTPYLYDRDVARKALELSGICYKIAFEQVYFTISDRAPEPVGQRKARPNEPQDWPLVLNWSDQFATPQFLRELNTKFPRKSRWELL